MKKISIYSLIIALIASIALVGCSPASPAEEPPVAPVEEPAVAPEEEPQVEEELVLTIEELAAFDGQDGSRAYVAVDGVIYDVTDADPWKNGKHNGFSAGKDLTREIKEVSPHGISKLANVVEVGILSE
jgi:predicted heme/steroid binding protein